MPNPDSPGATELETTARLVAALRDTAAFDHPVGRIETIETHISHVLLTGEYAYKIKKPLALDFLDFSSLAKRKFYCEQELRLNRRLAPDLYLAVVPITGSASEPRLGGPGSAIEYAVKMRQFASESRLDQVLARGELEPGHIGRLAGTAADFHARVARAEPGTRFADEASLRREMLENFEVLDRLRPAELAHATLDALRGWSEENLARIRATARARRAAGWVRECHGDMHLANMALIAGEPVIFDCIEFNERFRWIDVMSEAAFVIMDLDYRERTDLARTFLDAYLERTGDYAGLGVLGHYLVYRALVRAKVSAIRLHQSALSSRERDAANASVLNHVRLASRYQQDKGVPSLTLTHGVSGSGKSWLSQRLVPLTGAIRVRSDVERKRIHGVLPPDAGGRRAPPELYAPDATERTYARLEALARTIVGAGYPVIVDATFLAHEHRQRLLAAARELAVPAHILAVRAPTSVLRGRVAERATQGRDVSDATLAVVENQLEHDEPLTAAEVEIAITVDTGQRVDIESIARHLLPTQRSFPSPADAGRSHRY